MTPDKLNLNPIGMFNPTVIVATILIVIALYFALRRFFVMPYLRVLEEREQLFEAANNQTFEAQSCRQDADRSCEMAVAEATAEAETILSEARERADSARRASISEATASASTVLEKGRAEIASRREIERQRLRDEAIDCVRMACGRLVGGADEAAVAATVDRLMTRQAE